MSSKLKLYEIDELLDLTIQEVSKIAEENDGLLPDDWAHFLDDIQVERTKKILDIGRYFKSLEAEAEAVKTEKLKLALRQKHCETIAEKLKLYIINNIHAGEVFSDANTKLSWRKSEGVIISDESSIPEEFIKIERKIQIADIKKAIKSGVVVSGAKIETRNNLQIK
jgi:hypothetical protein